MRKNQKDKKTGEKAGKDNETDKKNESVKNYKKRDKMNQKDKTQEKKMYSVVDEPKTETYEGDN